MKCVTVSECKPIGQEADRQSQLTVTFQPLERLLNFASDAASLTGSFDVYIFTDEVPHSMDFGAFKASDRPNFLQWEPVASDADNMVARLQNPKILRPPIDVNLMSRRCPALCLLDHLSEQGWTGAPHIILHFAAAASSKVYDARKPVTR